MDTAPPSRNRSVSVLGGTGASSASSGGSGGGPGGGAMGVKSPARAQTLPQTTAPTVAESSNLHALRGMLNLNPRNLFSREQPAHAYNQPSCPWNPNLTRDNR